MGIKGREGCARRFAICNDTIIIYRLVMQTNERETDLTASLGKTGRFFLAGEMAKSWERSELKEPQIIPLNKLLVMNI